MTGEFLAGRNQLVGGEKGRGLLLSFASVNFIYSRTSVLQREYDKLKKTVKLVLLGFLLWS